MSLAPVFDAIDKETENRPWKDLDRRGYTKDDENVSIACKITEKRIDDRHLVRLRR